MSKSPVTGKKLGQMLVERGWITGEQLIRAIQSQRVVGGRIGTCLLEMDVLTEDQLLETLAQQLTVPAAQIEDLRAIGDGILNLIPSKVAARWQAVPFVADRNDIQVATLNARNLACLDEIEFCSNKRVLPHIANEVRIFEALERYYGVECPRRYGHLLDRLNRSRYMWDESAKILLGAGQTEAVVRTAPAPPSDTAAKPRAVIQAPASRSTQAASGRESRELMQAPASRSTWGMRTPPAPPAEPARPELPARKGAITWPTEVVGGPPAPPPAPATGGGTPVPPTLTLDHVERLLAGQSDQKAVGQTILRFLGQSFSRCAIFAVRNEGVRGWLHHGEGFDSALFRDLDIKLDQPSAFLGLIKGAEFFLGPLAPMPAHRELARCWGGELPQQCLMMPIRLRGRLVSILYGDRGALGVQGVQIEEIKELAEKAAIAFELCILRRKLQRKTARSPSE